MDLLKKEDIEKNRQVIVAGYGVTFQLDKRKAEKDMRFTRLNIYMSKSLGWNITFFYSAPYSKTCMGMSK